MGTHKSTEVKVLKRVPVKIKYSMNLSSSCYNSSHKYFFPLVYWLKHPEQGKWLE